MEDLNQDALRTLKHYHYWTCRMGLLELQRHLYKSDLSCVMSVVLLTLEQE